MDDRRWPNKIFNWQYPFRRKIGRPSEEWTKPFRNDRKGVEEYDLNDREAWGCIRI